MNNPALIDKLIRLLHDQKLGVLATNTPAGPYGSLVGFTASNDLTYVLFATTRSTRKYDNLIHDPGASLLIDSRTNQATDFHEAIAVTVTGQT